MSEAETQPNANQPEAGGAPGRVVGRVVSSKMNKSVTVTVERLVRHPVYGKYIRRTTTIMAHDEANACRDGDMVAIRECRPISKRKAWRVVEILTSAAAASDAAAAAVAER